MRQKMYCSEEQRDTYEKAKYKQHIFQKEGILFFCLSQIQTLCSWRLKDNVVSAEGEFEQDHRKLLCSASEESKSAQTKHLERMTLQNPSTAVILYKDKLPFCKIVQD